MIYKGRACIRLICVAVCAIILSPIVILIALIGDIKDIVNER